MVTRKMPHTILTIANKYKTRGWKIKLTLIEEDFLQAIIKTKNSQNFNNMRDFDHRSHLNIPNQPHFFHQLIKILNLQVKCQIKCFHQCIIACHKWKCNKCFNKCRKCKNNNKCNFNNKSQNKKNKKQKSQNPKKKNYRNKLKQMQMQKRKR